MKKPFTQSNYGWNLDGLIRCIKENKLKSEIVFSTPTSAIVRVVSYGESEILGAESTWCISQHRVSWEQYVEKTNGIQLFFYCFNHSVSGDDSLYGATFQVKGDIINTYCCFTRENHPLGKSRKFNTDEEALEVVVEKEFGKGVFKELANIIYEIYTNENGTKVEHKVTEGKVGKAIDLERVEIPYYIPEDDFEDYDDDYYYWNGRF
jgi:hypothetical protein